MSDPYIFISHSSKDNNAVAEIVDDLQAHKVQVWVDFDRLESGSQWLQSIQGAIDECAGVLIILSQHSRRADWVMRECLYAMQLSKPVFIALIDDVPLPLLLVDRQFNKLVDDYEEGIVRLIEALSDALAHPPKKIAQHPLPDGVSIDANESNFFAYLAQMEHGDDLATVARDLYTWSQTLVSDTEFSGRFRPALHARQTVADKSVAVFSILAYLRNPAVQIPFEYLRKYPPFNTKASRMKILKRLERLLPKDEGFEADRIDRRPAIPLDYLLGDATRLEAFKGIVTDIVEQLRQNE